MAGKGSEIGKNFQEVKQIIDEAEKLYGSSLEDKLGVCLDTCHIFDAGYDIVNSYEDVINEFDAVIGLEYLKVIHLNDSKNQLGSHKDRHENIGLGTIGFTNLYNVVSNEKLKDVPKILETPYVEKLYPPYKFEIESLKQNIFNPNLIEDIINYYK